MKQRIEYIDAIKGLAIFLMVVGHAVAWNYADYNEVCIFRPEQSINVKLGGVIWQLIYSFHMPLFFMVSGFLTYKAYRWTDFPLYVRKKAVRLLLPWFCTFWIVWLARGSTGYWFLLCLFQVSILGFLLMLLLEKVNPNRVWMIDAIIMVGGYVCLRMVHAGEWHLHGISLGRFVGAYIPFFSGVLLRKHKFLFDACFRSGWFYSLALALFAGLFLSRYLIGHGSIWGHIHAHDGILLALLGSLLVFRMFAEGRPARFMSLLSRLGKKTLPVYVLHVMFVIQAPAVGEFILMQNAETSIVLQITYSAVISVIAIVLSLCLYEVVAISPLFRRLFFGE